jgi:hypothetical protein
MYANSRALQNPTPPSDTFSSEFYSPGLKETNGQRLCL